MAARYRCGTAGRREAVRQAGVLNGIDYLEVTGAQTQLTVAFLQPLPGQAGAIPAAGTVLTKRNFRIEGGARVTGIRVIGAVPAGLDRITVTVDRRGDFSTYTLRLVASPSADAPPVGYDARLSELPFSFKVECPSGFDCLDVEDCPAPLVDEPLIDYLAKDYASFRRLMLDRMAVTMPDVRERNPADLHIALVDLLAYVGDHLSYEQDSVATEAYLGTARRRTSARRHSRLLDYAMHDGCAARAFLCLAVTPGSDIDGQELPAGLPFLDRRDGEGTRVSSAQYATIPVAGRVVFESLHPVRVMSTRNAIAFHTWTDTDCSLPAGATGATLVRPPGLDLAVGDVLVIEEVVDPATGDVAGGDPGHRHAVRLKTVTPGHDDHEGIDVLEVTWFAADVLPSAFCLSKSFDERLVTGMAVARGNVVLCDHGRTRPAAGLVPPSPSADAGLRYRPLLPAEDVTFAVPYRDAVARTRPARDALAIDPHAAVAALRLTAQDGLWLPAADLLEAGPFERGFVVEAEPGRAATIRFGNGLNGRAPNESLAFMATMRLGGGLDGDVGRDALVRVVTDSDGVERVWNPLPATGGAAPESIEQVRQFAPTAFRHQERAVTEADYAAIAERHPEVQRAQVTFRWTGSWYTAFIVVDRLGGGTLRDDPAFRADLLAIIDRYRMAGQDVELQDPVRVPLDLKLWICLRDGYFEGDVLARLRRAFGTGSLPGGGRGFFHPDDLTFGRSIYLSEILRTAVDQAGVGDARALVFGRLRNAPTDELANGRIRIGSTEIAQLDNDPNFPENGRLEFVLDGGL